MTLPGRVRRRIIIDVDTPRLGARVDEHDGAVVSIVLAGLPDDWRLEGVSTHRQANRSPWPDEYDVRLPGFEPETALDQP